MANHHLYGSYSSYGVIPTTSALFSSSRLRTGTGSDSLTTDHTSYSSMYPERVPGGISPAAAPTTKSHLTSQSSWSSVVDYESLVAGLKRSSNALYHPSVIGLGAHNTIGQSEDWYSAYVLAKRPKLESTSCLPVFPQRPGEKDCIHYMQTRTCKFGDSCRFDHPAWVPEGGLPDWKEVPLVPAETLPERPGVTDCPFFIKTQRCKYGVRCRFNHPKDHLVTSGAPEITDMFTLPERPTEPPCAFYMKTGICKFGATCKYHHPKGIQIQSAGREHGYADGAPGFVNPVESAAQFTPAMLHNVKGLPIRPGEADCPFYLKTGSCKYGVACRYNHPDRTDAATTLNIGIGNPVVALYQTNELKLSQSMLGMGFTVYPQRSGQTECDYYMKTGVCKYGEMCRFHHPIDRYAPASSVKLTLAGLPRREGSVHCPYYMKTGTCKYAVQCKFDHPPPGEVMTTTAPETTSTVLIEDSNKDAETAHEGSST